MDDNRIDKAAAFDTLFTNNRIQILKTLAYYIDPHLLKGLAVYIKFWNCNIRWHCLDSIRRLLCTVFLYHPMEAVSPVNYAVISCLYAMKRRKHPCSRSPRCLTISIIFKK